jgi:mutator family transposase
MAVEELDPRRVARAKRAYTTRRVSPESMLSLISGPAISPTSGDLVLARIDEIGKQRRIELTDGRRAHLFPGDEIIVCFGNRYAPDQYEGVIGEDLSSCDLVAAGGVASCEITRNERMIPSTRITPLGLIGDAGGNRLNLRDFAVTASDSNAPIKVVLSLGTSMNAGKTFTSTSLVRGLKGGGYRVAAIKATGTGAGNDLWIVRDAGADVVLDFTDGGLASTYLIPLDEIVAATERLIRSAAQQGCEVAIVEIADGLQHLETLEVIQAKDLWANAVGVVFAAYDSMGAKCGVDTLRAAGHKVLAVSGRLTQSPLMMRETERSTGLRVYTPWELQDGALTPAIMGQVSAFDEFCDNRYRVEISNAPETLSLGAGKTQVHANGESLSSIGTTHGIENGIQEHLKELLKVIAEKAMAVEVAAICGAGPRERRPSRINCRNGYRAQTWKTCAGRLELKVPRVRKGGYHPAFLRRNDPPAEELGSLLIQAVAPDATPHALERLLEQMGMTQIPPACTSAWSLDVKRKAMLLGLNSLVNSSAAAANGSLPDRPNGRRPIREEYGTAGGYGDDFAETDLFVSVETKPMRIVQINSTLGKT